VQCSAYNGQACSNSLDLDPQAASTHIYTPWTSMDADANAVLPDRQKAKCWRSMTRTAD